MKFIWPKWLCRREAPTRGDISTMIANINPTPTPFSDSIAERRHQYDLWHKAPAWARDAKRFWMHRLSMREDVYRLCVRRDTGRPWTVNHSNALHALRVTLEKDKPHFYAQPSKYEHSSGRVWKCIVPERF